MPKGYPTNPQDENKNMIKMNTRSELLVSKIMQNIQRQNF